MCLIMSWITSWLEMLSIPEPEVITEIDDTKNTILRRHSHHLTLSNNGLTGKNKVIDLFTIVSGKSSARILFTVS